MCCGTDGVLCACLQEKSYFALALPHGWWLFGLDLALVDDIDMCQCRLEPKPLLCLVRHTQAVSELDLPALDTLQSAVFLC